MNQQYTLIDIDNALDNLYVYDQLGCAQHALLHAILRIFNRLRFPNHAIISNVELERKSGVLPGSFHRTRDSLTQFRLDPNNSRSWIVSYQAGNKQSAGTYKINYSFIFTNTYTTPTLDQQDTNSIPTEVTQEERTPCNTTPTLDQHNIVKMAKFDNDLRKNRIDQKEKNRKEETRPEGPVDKVLSNELEENSQKENWLVGSFFDKFSEKEKRKLDSWFNTRQHDLIIKYFNEETLNQMKGLANGKAD